MKFQIFTNFLKPIIKEKNNKGGNKIEKYKQNNLIYTKCTRTTINAFTFKECTYTIYLF